MKKSRLFIFGVLALMLAACSTGNSSGLPTATLEGVILTAVPPHQTPVSTITPTVAALNGEQFDQALAQAMEKMDFNALKSLMGVRFSIATYGQGPTSLTEYPTNEALQNLQQGPLAAGAKPAAQFKSDVPALLKGTDPLSLWGPNAQPVRALHVTGLGANAKDEAILVIATDKTTNQLYWHGILLPEGGSFLNPTLPTGVDVLPTNVKYVKAKDVLNMRSGPGTNYDIVSLMQSGETAAVHGTSGDKKWWLIDCTTNKNESCWISADPELSQPVDKP